MAWDEWEQLKADAAARMNLASAGGGGGSGGDVKTSKVAWNKAAAGVSGLRGNLKKATGKLDDGQTGLGATGAAVTGFVSGSAQIGVYQSWQRYLDLLGRECGEVAGKLEKAGSDYYTSDAAIGDAFKQQLTKADDPPAARGGHPTDGGDRS